MKKLPYLLLLLLMGFSGSLFAAFLENIPQKLSQPDGTVVGCYASGDEYYHWLHDANGFTIIQNRSTGYFVYADRIGDDLIPTTLQPGVDNPAVAGLKPRLNISSEKYRAHFASRFKAPAEKSGYSYSNTGNYNNLVIFIRFSNQDEYAEPLTRYSSAFNGSGTVSMTEYFKEVSKSQLAINTTFYPNPNGTTIVSYQDSHSRKYYQPYSSANTEGYRTDAQSVEREMTLLKNAAEYVGSQAIASGINYDHNNDNRIDNVCFVVQGATDGWSDLLWPHRWVLYQYDVRIGDDRVYDFNFQLSDALGVSVLCHEMFHSLGAPDLYRYENDDITPVGPWDLMAHNKTPPQHMSAYMKMKYGKWFSQIPTITTDGTYTLKPLATDGFAAYKIPSPNSTSEFFVVEYRKATGRFESSLVGSGLIISRVNSSLEGNAEGPPDEIYVYRQNGTTRNDGNINNATFSSSVGRTEFGDDTGPSDFLSSGAAGGIHIYNIGAAGETISFTVGTGGALNPPQELMATLSGRNVSLSWKKPLSGSGTLAGYKVYRNAVLVSSINNVNTLSFEESNLSAGTYEYYVTARYTSPTGESSGSNEITVVVSPEPKPDLIITNSSVFPINVEPGSTVSLSSKLVNSGPAQAGNSVLRVYLSQDNVFDSGDRQLASGVVDPIDAGAEAVILIEDIKISSTTEVGKWYVIFWADADGNVPESIENNNRASTLLTVGNPSLNPPRNLMAQVYSTSVKLIWTMPETGDGTLSGYSVYRNAVKVGSVNNPATLEFMDNDLALGTYAFYVTAVYSSPAGESAKSNEVLVTLTNESKPDLTIRNFEVSPAVIASGGSIDMSCVLLNIGAAQAPSTQIQLYLSRDLNIDDQDIYLAYGTIDPLDAGASISVSGGDITLPTSISPGTWYALIKADADAAVDESNETNNQASFVIIVQGQAPDLQLVGLTLYPAVVVPNSNVRATVMMYNAGNLTANPVKLAMYLSADEILDNEDILLFNESARLLLPKGSISFSSGFILPASVVPGQYFMIGIADPDDLVNEYDESNNQLIRSVVVASTSGTDDPILSGHFRIFPIPASDWVNIEYDGLLPGSAELSVFNAFGNPIYHYEIRSGGSLKMKVDISSWASGFYMIRMICSGRALTAKLLVK